MQIPEHDARSVRDAFRNGLLHRGMVKTSIEYALTGGKPGRPAKMKGDIAVIYIWELRNVVVSLVEQYGSKIWKGTSSPLAKVVVGAS